MADDPNPPSGGGTGDPPADPPKDPPADPPKDPPADPPGEPAPKKTVLTDADGPQGAPEEYADFTLPEGMEVNQDLLDAILPVFKEIDLTQIQGQMLNDAFAKSVQAQAQADSDSYKQQVEDWEKESKADPLIGGDNYLKNVGIAKAAIDKFGSPAYLKRLNDTGLGSDPETIKAWYKVGLTLKEDDPGGGDPPTGDKSPAEIMYPDDKKSG